MKTVYLIYYFLILFGSVSDLCSQDHSVNHYKSSHEVTFNLKYRTDSLFVLPDQFIVAGSEEIYLDTLKLQIDIDYHLDYRFGKIILSQHVLQSNLIDSSNHVLKVKYRSLPFYFKPVYAHREQFFVNDSVIGEGVLARKTYSSFSVDDIFGSNLQKSGSIVRGFSIGTNRDLSLNSGFRLQMAGNLTDDIGVIATMTDENSPLQPEGTTQMLQEVDKVFIELHGSSFSTTFGDMNVSLGGNEFGNVNRKLTGAKGSVDYQFGNIKGDAFFAGAVARGKFVTNQFLGADGIQGPYRLTGDNNNRDIIIIAGTERVYIDGEKMVRSENADYTIDYANAEITFTPKRLISHGSRIVVDFEYNDRQYNRSFIGAKAGLRSASNNWQFNSTYMRESDNEDSPVDLVLSDTDKTILRNTGDDRLKAFRSGVELVGVGKGQYLSFDTLITISNGNDSLMKVYRFNPNDTLRAVYSITFSDVGLGNGNYKKISIGNYEFVGYRQGNFEPIRLLPMPQSHTLFDFDLTGLVIKNIKLTGEYSVSNFNLNKFSNNAQRNGSAMKFGVNYSVDQIQIGGKYFGSLDINLKKRYVGKKFLSMDRTNEVEFSRRWNLIDTINQDENLTEGSLTYKPVQYILFNGGLGSIQRGEQFSSSRYNFGLQVEPENLPNADYSFERISTQNKFIDMQSDWIRQKGNVQYQVGLIKPHLRISSEYLGNRSQSIDTMMAGSYRWNEISPGISIGSQPNLFFNLNFGWQWDDSLWFGSLRRASNVFLNNYSAQWLPTNSFSTKLDLTFQQRKFTEIFKRKSNEDINSIILRSLTKLNPLENGIESDWYYEVETGRSAKLEKVFRQVPKGTGNYIYVGDVNNNHIIDQQDFQLSRYDGDYIAYTAPTDQLIPIIDLKASSRVRLTPSKFVSDDSWFGKAISMFSSESYFRVEEKNTESDKKQIYLLHLKRFLDEQKTIAGSNLITQDIFLLENNKDISLRYRYVQRNGLTQYALQTERTYMHENSVRLRWQLIQEIANQMDYSSKIDVLMANQFNVRDRNINSQSFTSDWSYRPFQELELGFQFGYGGAINFDTTKADMNDQSVRFVYSFAEQGQARAEFSREEVLLTNVNGFIPYELTNGQFKGKSWLWKLNIEYRVSKYIQLSINYDGRSEGEHNTVHNGKAEVRAFF